MKKLITVLIALTVCALIVVATPQKKMAKKAVTTPPQATATVKVTNFKFEPKTLTIKAGTTVTWTSEGGTHTVISDGKTFSSDNLASGKSFSHQFTKPGKYPYYCSFHGDKGGADMAGTIIVTK